MDNQSKTSRRKVKAKKVQPKTKTPKKRKCDGPTCSMFLAELTRKLTHKKKQEEEAPLNIVQTIVRSIASALPIVFSKKASPERIDSPVKIETLQELAPELQPINTSKFPKITSPKTLRQETSKNESINIVKNDFKLIKMPVTSSDFIKPDPKPKKAVPMEDAAVNTGGDHDVASEIAKHVGTLRKISLIAEEFNQKTAKSLKEIVDSVQEDLLKKLENIQKEQKIKAGQQSQEEPMEIEVRP